jgi:pimeloyl-ACP methyl ester carboxylesterase
LASLWGRQQLAVGEQVGELFLLAGVADEALTAGRPATMKEGVVGVERFAVDVPQATLDDLDARLARTRWPGELDGAGWEDGTSPAFLQELVGWWQTGFDWRAQEAAINRFPQFRATVDGIGLHFVHVRGKGPAPLPLVLTHGWPSTFYELLPLVPLLTDPTSYGGDPADAFDVVIPSLPGYGFSDPLQGRGSSNRVPKLWVQLMGKVLGYERFGAHGGDIGAMVANRLALEHPEPLVGIHVTRAADPYVGPGAAPLTPAEQALLAARARWHEAEGGYVHLQRTRPQTLAYGLADSPVGLAAWILEKWQAWSDCDGQVERRFTKDELLTTVMLYWVTGTIGPSFRFHRDWALGAGSLPQALAEALANRAEVPPGVVRPLALGERIQVPAAVTLFDYHCPREWAERAYGDLRRFTDMPRGGHFTAMEEPELLAQDLRGFFRGLR